VILLGAADLMGNVVLRHRIDLEVGPEADREHACGGRGGRQDERETGRDECEAQNPRKPAWQDVKILSGQASRP
jgi:hypothetical protein